MFEIQTRKQAAAAGNKRFYTGRPCSKGHDCQRFTSTGACIKCAAGYVQKYNDQLRQETNARASGQFIYPLHPDDVAAALAYCQALDLQRGRAPWSPSKAAQRNATSADAEAIRRRVFGDRIAHMSGLPAVAATLPAHALSDAEDAALTDAVNAAHNANVALAWANKK